MIRLSVVIIAVGDTIGPHCDIDELKGYLIVIEHNTIRVRWKLLSLSILEYMA